MNASPPPAGPFMPEAVRRVDRQLHAFTELFEPTFEGVHPGPLSGLTIAVKDNICTAAGHTTACSRILEGYRSPFNATAVERLLAAGARIVGKTNMDEFGMGSSTEHSARGPTKNPWDVACVSGGSSGGSAAAVAAGLVPAALGSDTGGSIRQPAAHCGVVGLKPTYGRVSRFGLIAYASSLDVIGTITRSVRDAARVLEVIGGGDALDASSSSRPMPNMLENLEQPIDGLRIGLVQSMISDDNHPAVNKSVRAAADRLREAGATIIETDLPHTQYTVATYYIVATAEASSNLARYDGVRYGWRARLSADDSLEEMYIRTRTEGFGHEVRRRIMLGTHVLSAGYYDAFYGRALKVRRLIKKDYDAAFKQHGLHAMLAPVAPGPAFRFGEKLDDPLALYLEDMYTVGPSLAGLPAIAMPAGFTNDACPLPIGVQLIGRAFEEPSLLRVARMLEAASEDVMAKQPPVFLSSDVTTR